MQLFTSREAGQRPAPRLPRSRCAARPGPPMKPRGNRPRRIVPARRLDYRGGPAYEVLSSIPGIDAQARRQRVAVAQVVFTDTISLTRVTAIEKGT